MFPALSDLTRDTVSVSCAFVKNLGEGSSDNLAVRADVTSVYDLTETS